MSNLISRNELIYKIRGIVPGSQDVDFIVGLIEKQHTAFDTEKVVEQLNNVLQDLNVIEILSQFDPDSTIQTSLDRFLNAVRNELLNTVKKGGVE